MKLNSEQYAALDRLLLHVTFVVDIIIFLESETGLENSTRPLVFTSASGCRASKKNDISSENLIFSHICQYFRDAGQVLILRYFEAWEIMQTCT